MLNEVGFKFEDILSWFCSRKKGIRCTILMSSSIIKQDMAHIHVVFISSCKFLQMYFLWCVFAFHRVLLEHSNRQDYIKSIADLRMGIYEDLEIDTKTGSRPIRF